MHVHIYQCVQKSEEDIGCLALCFFALFPLDRVSSEPGASLEDRMSVIHFCLPHHDLYVGTRN